jgi:hypothetical protein
MPRTPVGVPHADDPEHAAVDGVERRLVRRAAQCREMRAVDRLVHVPLRVDEPDGYIAAAALLRVAIVTWDAEQRDRAAPLVRVFAPDGTE